MEEEFDEDDVKAKRVSTNIETVWIQVLPKKQEFLDTI